MLEYIKLFQIYMFFHNKANPNSKYLNSSTSGLFTLKMSNK